MRHARREPILVLIRYAETAISSLSEILVPNFTLQKHYVMHYLTFLHSGNGPNQVVIMLVIDKENDRALLSRQSRFVPRMWSCLAGFIEV